MPIQSQGQENEESIEKGAGHISLENVELAHVAIPVKEETTKTDVVAKSNSNTNTAGFQFSDKAKRNGRLVIFLGCIGFLIIGRFSVPEIEVFCVEDKALEVLEFANNFINKPGNEIFRNIFQLICSLLIDITFIITVGYWVLRGKSGRLPISLGVFYIVRALVQKIWISPFPPGFYWETPWIPSLVVPYGRGSDFFFSGHSGFLVICALEWHKAKMSKIRNFVIAILIYTILILLVYRIHYSIDIFAGVFFADWCFYKIDLIKDRIDALWVTCLTKIRNLFIRKKAKLPQANSLPVPTI